MKNKKHKILFMCTKKGTRNLFFIIVASFLSYGAFGSPAVFARGGMTLAQRTLYNSYIAQGYTCVDLNTSEDIGTIECTKITNTYYGVALSSLSVQGGVNTSTQTGYVGIGYNSPFIYIKNLPKNGASIVINSKLNKYFSKPAFNEKNGWVIERSDGKIKVSGKEESNLFYELALYKIDLNRNGRNFSSKNEVISFLENSDFFKRLGFTETEKKNSLDYFLPKIQSAQDTNYYYLTILSDSAIEEISNLNIKPKPNNLIRQYFALYPTDVPVKTEGDFVFPKNVNDNNKFSIKETGEVLVFPSMLIFWDKKYEN